MDRPSATTLALRTIGSIFEAAAPFSTTVAGTNVEVSVERLAPEPIPDDLAELGSSDPWPRAVRVRAHWNGGKVSLLLMPKSWTADGRYRGHYGLRVEIEGGARELVWANITNTFIRAGSKDVVSIGLLVSLVKRGENLDLKEARANHATPIS